MLVSGKKIKVVLLFGFYMKASPKESLGKLLDSDKGRLKKCQTLAKLGLSYQTDTLHTKYSDYF